jgi:F-type H+-transporting ATPase subunit delta
MSHRASANRYAKALFEVSLREADPRQVDEELAGVFDVITRHEPLRKALLNPAVPPAAKRNIIAELSERAGISPVLHRILRLLAERDRLVLLPDLVDAYRQRLMDHLQIVRADVTTATPLPEDRLRALQASLAQATGRQVAMTTKIDPAIIGGVVARIGSTVYDGSVVGQLQRIRERMVEGT